MIRSVILWSLLVVSSLVQAQDISFKALVPSTVEEGSTFQITYVLEGAKGGVIDLPDFGNIRRVGGVESRSTMQNIQGQVSVSEYKTFTFQAPKTGTYTIPSATIRVNNQSYTSTPTKLRVLPRGKKSTALLNSKKNVICRLESSKESVYRGEQIIIDYTVYFNENISIGKLSHEDDFQGLNIVEINSNARRSNPYQGKYEQFVAKSYAAFPQDIGTYNIKPYDAEIKFPVKNNRSFFPSYKSEYYTSNELKFEVKDLPEPKPSDFIGVVGSYEVKASINKDQISTNDALSLQLQISGNGNSKMMTIPTLDIGDAWDVFDANLANESNYIVGNSISHTNVYEYILTPKKSGTQVLTPQFSVFDPYDETYKQIVADSMVVNVIQGKTATVDTPNKPPKSIRPLMATALNASINRSSPFLNMSYLIPLAMLVLLLLGLLFYKSKLDKEARLSSVELLKRGAATKALMRLQKARTLLKGGQGKEFYEEVTHAIHSYLVEKFGLKPELLTKENVCRFLEKKSFTSEVIEQYRTIATECEIAIYAGIGSSDDKKNDLLNSADRLLRYLGDH